MSMKLLDLKTDAGALSPTALLRHSEVLDTFKPVTERLKTVWGKNAICCIIQANFQPFQYLNLQI